RAALGQTASRLQIRQEDALVRIEHLGRLGHEVDAAENDRARGDSGGGAGQLEAVAGAVGQLLDLSILVIMGQNRGVFANLQTADLIQDVVQRRDPLFFVWR